jgi:hypothetical protein|tara:strand:+ start:55 stop:207 length:153 start_codon:yes stop_codon:yes gene_type:complete
MNIWDENYIINIAIKLDNCNSLEEATTELENKLATGEINLNNLEFSLTEI